MKWLAGVAFLSFLASCGNVKKETASTEASVLPLGVTVQNIDQLELTTLKDNEGDKRMPNKLFYSLRDSARVELLSPEGSVASSIHCFLVETEGKKVLFDRETVRKTGDVCS